jgi:hypothetical protein
LIVAIFRQILSECQTSTDCRPHEQDEICFQAVDAICTNLPSTLIDVDRALFYNWGQENFRFHRGRALVFYDDPHICHAYNLGKCFGDLDYVVKIFRIDDIISEIGTPQSNL